MQHCVCRCRVFLNFQKNIMIYQHVCTNYTSPHAVTRACQRVQSSFLTFFRLWHFLAQENLTRTGTRHTWMGYVPRDCTSCNHAYVDEYKALFWHFLFFDFCSFLTFSLFGHVPFLTFSSARKRKKMSQVLALNTHEWVRWDTWYYLICERLIHTCVPRRIPYDSLIRDTWLIHATMRVSVCTALYACVSVYSALVLQGGEDP